MATEPFDVNIHSVMQVERTKLRPVASGVLTPFQGLCFLGFQLLLGLGILLQLNNYRLVPVSIFSYLDALTISLGVDNFFSPCMIRFMV